MLFLRNLFASFAVLATGIFLLFLTVTAVNLLYSASKSPTDYLPKEHTAAYFSGMGINPIIPIAKLLPQSESLELKPENQYAILKKDESEAVVIFSPRSKSKNSDKYFGKFAVSSAEKWALKMLSSSGSRLSSSREFQDLLRIKEERGEFAFFSKNTFEEIYGRETVSGEYDLFGELIPKSCYSFAMRASSGSLILGCGPYRGESQMSLPSSINSSFSGALSIIRSANGEKLWRYAAEGLNEGSAVFLEGSVRRLVENKFGPDVSLDFDILPLFPGLSSLAFGKTASGKSVLVLEGTYGNPGKLNATLNKLHSEFLTNLPKHLITRRNLEKRFNSADIRLNPDSISQEESQYLRWKINTSYEKDNPGNSFSTAARGGSFAVSNDLGALKQILNRNAGTALPALPAISGSLRIADGIFFPGISGLIEILPKQFAGVSKEIEDIEKPVYWSVEKKGKVVIFELEPWNFD